MNNNIYDNLIDIDDGILLKKGKNPGPTLAVFAGIHGNEKVGVLAIAKVVSEIEITSGSVYFVFANPPAIKASERSVNKNLNRCFLKENNGDTWEDARARKLMKILDVCDSLLDLHASNIPESTPFAICEELAFPFVKNFDIKIVSTGWDSIEPGATDGYMLQNGKPGVCLECGFADDGDLYMSLAEKSIYAFLRFYRVIEGAIENQKFDKKRLVHVDRVIKRTDDVFEFAKEFKDFEKLDSGKVFASDSRRSYIAEDGDVILFAHPVKEMGAEMCILGKEIGFI